MRSQTEIMALILQVANEDERILGVYMNGSRVNKNAPVDLFQDYDIVYVVKDTLPFRQDKNWIQRFGEILYMQYPDENYFFPHDVKNWYGWLMQFSDGNRMDIHVETLSHALQEISKDSLCTILLDKDHTLPSLAQASDIDYWIARPSEELFNFVCNEFWWCLNNAVKGTWRNEIPFAQDVLNELLRPQCFQMLSWDIGVKTNFSVSVGKSGKFMQRWLSVEDYEAYLSTYANQNSDEIWLAMDNMCKLFQTKAILVADKLEFKYNQKEAAASYAYMKHVQMLPKDAKEIY